MQTLQLRILQRSGLRAPGAGRDTISFTSGEYKPPGIEDHRYAALVWRVWDAGQTRARTEMLPSALPNKRAQSAKETRITDVLNVRSPVMHWQSFHKTLTN